MPVIYGIGFNLFLMSCNFYMAVSYAVLYALLAGRHSYYGYSHLKILLIPASQKKIEPFVLPISFIAFK